MTQTNHMIVIVPGRAEVTEMDRPATLQELQERVGGYIEHVPYWFEYEGEPCQAWCNEEGRIQGMPVNTAATRLWHSELARQLEKRHPSAIAIELLIHIELIHAETLHGPVVILTGAARCD